MFVLNQADRSSIASQKIKLCQIFTDLYTHEKIRGVCYLWQAPCENIIGSEIAICINFPLAHRKMRNFSGSSGFYFIFKPLFGAHIRPDASGQDDSYFAKLARQAVSLQDRSVENKKQICRTQRHKQISELNRCRLGEVFASA